MTDRELLALMAAIICAGDPTGDIHVAIRLAKAIIDQIEFPTATNHDQ